METFDLILQKINSVVCGLPTIILILVTGFLLTIRLRGLQFRKLGLAFKSIFQEKDENAHGEVSPFGALCTALSATIGTGNIVGVATAICTGGPGALFWMWLAALVGIATKYSECMLALKYREKKEDGHILGGPFCTIEKGMGKKWKWLAVLFAIFGVLAGIMGIGTITQINGITSAVKNAIDPESLHTVSIFGADYSISVVISGILVTIFTALVIIGGLRRISKVAEVIVPAMALIYVFLGLSVLIMNMTRIPEALSVILKSAFGWQAATGGATGFCVAQVISSMQKGVARGIFSNEAGLGSAPIAACTAQVQEPVEQGLVSMLGTFIDTIIVCSMTGLAIVIAFFTDGATGVGDLEGVAVTSGAFSKVLGGDGRSVQFLIMLCLIFFAFTTILGWNYYSERCLEYLTNGKMKIVKAFRVLYILAVFVGPYLTVKEVWEIADITNCLMAIPNCISLIVLSGVCARTTHEYFAKS
ncbi:alanine/glycine:cation symporter family protein [Treponema zioleckii]|uniref:alanine/glycine:cation symporter family protein n=1 Tax=Treponema zioleckii TaxID=331680 RepID=UPI00168BE695|nr:sodium:alanine symporter family protein [Treponema zioleckii]